MDWVLTYLNQQNSVNILAVVAYYTPNQQKFYEDHTELYKFDIGAVIQFTFLLIARVK